MNDTPILFIDDDEDDQHTLAQVLNDLRVTNPLICFLTAQAALEYLRSHSQSPFMIISEISLSGPMNGLELRQQIDQDPQLRQKSIPFIFLTTPIVDYLVQEAYGLTIQGLFEKSSSYAEWKQQLSTILHYWQQCVHPK